MSSNIVKLKTWLEAANKGDLETVRKLVEEGFNVDSKGNDGRTALMNAAGSGNTEVVRFLLKSKADVNRKANNGLTALGYACKTDWDGLFIGETRDMEGTIRTLLENKALVDENVIAGALGTQTPQMFALLLRANSPALRDRRKMKELLDGEMETGDLGAADKTSYPKNLQMLKAHVAKLK